MADAETILNLWYIHDEMGVIYSLLARAYVGTGTEKENLALLQRYANVDYLIARPFPIPDRFHVQIVEKGKTRVLPVTPPGFLSTLNNHLALWEDAIKQMEADLPGQMGLSIPDAPLYCSTALLMDDAGRVFSGRRLLRLKRKDENVEVVESTWALIVAFLAKQGWATSEPADCFVSGNKSVTEKVALALAAAGQDVFCRALKNPAEVQVRFDMAKFAEIVDFASGGGFDITGQH